MPSSRPFLLFLHVPNPQSSVICTVPARSLQRPARCIVQEIPFPRIICPHYAAAVPALPAGQHTPVFAKQVPVTVDKQPFIGRICPVILFIPVFPLCILFPSCFCRSWGFRGRCFGCIVRDTIAPYVPSVYSYLPVLSGIVFIALNYPDFIP